MSNPNPDVITHRIYSYQADRYSWLDIELDPENPGVVKINLTLKTAANRYELVGTQVLTSDLIEVIDNLKRVLKKATPSPRVRARR